PKPGFAAASPTDTWNPGDGKSQAIEAVAGVHAPPVERFLPTGTLLLGGDVERMTGRPMGLRGSARWRVLSPPCDGRKEAAPAAPPRRFGGLAPFEQRKLRLIGGHDDSLAILQRIEAILANLPPSAQTVAEVVDSKFCGDCERLALPELSKIPKSYAGHAVG